LELRSDCNLPTKAIQIKFIISAAQRKDFGICQQEQLKLTAFRSAALREILELRPKAVHSVQPCSENLLNGERKYCILLSYAAKNFGIATNSTAFVQKTLELQQKHCIWFSRAEKIAKI
jgi:hypothetical protein